MVEVILGGIVTIIVTLIGFGMYMARKYSREVQRQQTQYRTNIEDAAKRLNKANSIDQSKRDINPFDRTFFEDE